MPEKRFRREMEGSGASEEDSSVYDDANYEPEPESPRSDAPARRSRRRRRGGALLTKFIRTVRAVVLDTSSDFVEMNNKSNGVVIRDMARFQQWFAAQGGREGTPPADRFCKNPKLDARGQTDENSLEFIHPRLAECPVTWEFIQRKTHSSYEAADDSSASNATSHARKRRRVSHQSRARESAAASPALCNDHSAARSGDSATGSGDSTTRSEEEAPTVGTRSAGTSSCGEDGMVSLWRMLEPDGKTAPPSPTPPPPHRTCSRASSVVYPVLLSDQDDFFETLGHYLDTPVAEWGQWPDEHEEDLHVLRYATSGDLDDDLEFPGGARFTFVPDDDA